MNKDELKSKVPKLLGEILPFGGTEPHIQSHIKMPQDMVSPDMVVKFRVSGRMRQLVIEVKPLGYPSQLLQALAPLKKAAERLKGYPMIITDSISERGASLLKDAGVCYIDLCGNCYLKIDGMYIEKSGKEKAKRPSGELRRLFSTKATRIIRTLLEFHKKPWEAVKLAEASKVSVGHAYKVTKKLIEQGFLTEEKHKLHLIDAGKLLDAWAEQYKINPSSIRSFYTGLKDTSKFMANIAQAAKRKKLTCAFTLHAGESLVAPFTRFTDVHFYLCEPVSDSILEAFNLERIEFGGTVHIIEPYDGGVFQHLQAINSIPVVCNTQLYLDLFQYPTRGKEAAKFLREQKMEI